MEPTTFALLGAGVLAFDAYAYYKYKHASDVFEDNEEGLNVLEGIRESVFPEAVEETIEEPAEEKQVKLGEFEPAVEDQLVQMAQSQQMLLDEVKALRKEVGKLKKARPRAKH